MSSHGAPAVAVSRRSKRKRILSGVGEALTTLGVLGLLFLVWELWWTGLGADREREQAVQELHSAVETVEEIDTAERAANGDVMAVVYAPRLGEDWRAPVKSGVEAESLDRAGLGHYESTELPGEPGNFALAGHRQTYGNILWNQDAFVPGDPIHVQTADGWYTYEVTETYVVEPTESAVLAPVPGSPGEDPGDASVLTLTTCHPPYTTRERMITHAELVDRTTLDGAPPAGVPGEVATAWKETR